MAQLDVKLNPSKSTITAGLKTSGIVSYIAGPGIIIDGRIIKADFTIISTATNLKNGVGTKSIQQNDGTETFINDYSAVGIEIGEVVQDIPGEIVVDAENNKLTVTNGAFGESSAIFGGKSLAHGKRALAEGTSTLAIGNYSHAEGNATVARAAEAHTEGLSTVAYGIGSHAEGTGTVATGLFSHTEGTGTFTTGNYAHAEGDHTEATSSAAHSEGLSTTASGPYSHAEGSNNTASGSSSHAEGLGNTASGNVSHVEGQYNDANGKYGVHIEGLSNIASKGFQTVIGQYNDFDHDSDAIFVVGNGEVIDETVIRKDAFQVLTDGSAKVGRDVTSSDADLTVATKKYVDDHTTSYTAGYGLNLTDHEFSVDTTAIAEKSDVSEEAQTRQQADQQLGLAIQDEEATRAEYDTALNNRIDSLESRGRFLSTWNATTGLPSTYPTIPETYTELTYIYTFRAGDYYIIHNVGSNNLRPKGSSITANRTTTADPWVWAVQSETETSPVSDNGTYTYDGTNWVLMGAGAAAAWGSIGGNIADQTDLQTALSAKANDNAVVHNTGTETIAGTKTFSNEIIVNGVNKSSAGVFTFGNMVSEIQFQNGSIAPTADYAYTQNAAFKTKALMANTTYTGALGYMTGSGGVATKNLTFNVPTSKSNGIYTLATTDDLDDFVTTNTAQEISGEKTFSDKIHLASSKTLEFDHTTYPANIENYNGTMRINPYTNNTYYMYCFGQDGMYPFWDNVRSSGLSNHRWTTVYTTNLSDATNSVAVANIATTNTEQTISAKKTFSVAPDIAEINHAGSILLNPNYNWVQSKGDVVPFSNNAMNLGVEAYKWKNLWLAGNISDGTNTMTVADIVDKNTTQTITGNKTFTSINGSSSQTDKYLHVNNNNQLEWVTGTGGNYVTIDTDQTITGVKTFDNDVRLTQGKILTFEDSSYTALVRNETGILTINPNDASPTDKYCFNSAALYPSVTAAKDLGTSSTKWKDLYLSGNLTDGTNSVSIAAISTDKLPTVVNDKYLHTNATTGALEWSDASGGGGVTKYLHQVTIGAYPSSTVATMTFSLNIFNTSNTTITTHAQLCAAMTLNVEYPASGRIKSKGTYMYQVTKCKKIDDSVITVYYNRLNPANPDTYTELTYDSANLTIYGDNVA